MSSVLRKKIQLDIPPSIISRLRIGIAVSEWHPDITEKLFTGAEQFLLQAGIRKGNILRLNAPGSYELPLAAQMLLNRKCDAAICLGCVIKGETDHYDFICSAVSKGIMNVSLKYNKPVTFGVLTTRTLKQALARTGGKLGNKGEEAAEAVLKMI